MTVTIGIPFRASPYLSALYLCLSSIRFYAGYVDEIALLVDVTGDRVFDESKLRKDFPELKLRIKYWKRDEEKSPFLRQKQRLVNWLLFEEFSAIDQLVLLHSDVYLTRPDGLKKLIGPLQTQSATVSCHFEIPFTFHRSTFHKDEASLTELALAPRYSSWFMALNGAAYKEFRMRKHRSNDLFEIRRYRFDDPNQSEIHTWIREHMRNVGFKGDVANYQMDASAFFRYEMERGHGLAVSLGTAQNPSLKTLELLERYPGFVHIEQFNPDRFDGSIYSPTLFERRADQISALLLEKYGIQQR